jgi:hypothetical protein
MTWRLSLIALVVVAAAAACGSSPTDTCTGPGDAGVNGVTVSVGPGGAMASYGSFIWGENNDCPATGSQVISVTIRGPQIGAPGGIGLCLPRPDLVGSDPIPLADRTRVQLVTVSATVLGPVVGGTCTTELAASPPPTGTVRFAGFCTRAGAAFAMTFSGEVAGRRTCGATVDDVTMSLGGTVAVTPQ